MKRFFVALLATMTVLTCMGGGTYAEENAGGVVKSIFSPEKTLESTTTIGRDKPTGEVQNVGEIEVEVGQTITDEGFINKFKTSEAVAGDLEYGTTTFSTSISGVVVDGQFYDVQNDMDKLDKMIEYVTQDVQSSVTVNYDIKNQTGGQAIKYSFTGKKSTGDNYVYVYYHYYVNGKAANGQEITRGGYLGYKIKVKPATGGLIYDANGGTIKGKATFDDKDGRVAPDPSDTSFMPKVKIDIISDEPVRDGYKFAFWYEEALYPDDKEVYTDQALDTDVYPVPDGKHFTIYEMSLPFRKSRTKTLKAAWDKEYSLKYDVDGNTNIVREEKGMLGLNLDDLSIKSKDIDVAAGVAREKGGEFKCWRDTDNVEYQTGTKFKLTENKSDVTLKAIWNITTEYVDNKGKAIEGPVVAEKVGEQKTFAGYTFKEKKDTPKGVKYIYEKNKITTQYVDDKGNKIQEPFVGEEKGPKEIAGYKFLREEATENGVKYIYEKIKTPTPPNPQTPGQASFGYDSSRLFFGIVEKKADEKRIAEKKDDRQRVECDAYIFGYTDNTIRPNETLTRAEAAAMVTRLAKLNLSDKSRADYPDLKEKAWYLANINAALKAGMLDTDKDGNLRPDAPVTRGEFIKMIAAVDKGGQGKAPFNDIAGHKYEKEINKVYSSGRITGYEDGSFKPDAFLTRAEAATLLNRVFDRSADAKAIEGFEDKIYKFKDLDKNAWYYYELVEATNSHEFIKSDGKDSMDRTLEKWTKLLNK